MTLVEYADLQCPYCAEWSHRAFPALVDRYVRQGKVRIVFRGLAFLGPDSDRALRTAVAAGRENRLWNVVEGLYHRQGHENSGWVTEALLDEVAGPRAVAARNAPWVVAEMADSSRAARAAGIAGTPAFQIGKPEGRCRRSRSTRSGRRAFSRRSRRCSPHDRPGASFGHGRAGASRATVAGYLVWVRETGATLVCATGGCGTVQSSEYAEVAGVPVALLGLVGYVVLFAAAFFPGETARLAQATVALGAVLFSTYLLYVQVALIGEICDWCLVSDAIVTSIALLALLRLRVGQSPPASSIRPADSA